MNKSFSPPPSNIPLATTEQKSAATFRLYRIGHCGCGFGQELAWPKGNIPTEADRLSEWPLSKTSSEKCGMNYGRKKLKLGIIFWLTFWRKLATFGRGICADEGIFSGNLCVWEEIKHIRDSLDNERVFQQLSRKYRKDIPRISQFKHQNDFKVWIKYSRNTAIQW